MLILILGFSASIAAGMPEAAPQAPSGMQLLHGEMAEDMHSDNCGFSHEKVDAGIKKAISFLKERQLPSGGFATYISNSSDMANGIYIPSVIFDTTIVLHSLKFVDSDSEVDEMKIKIVEFLLANKEEPGVWGFYGKDPSIPSELNSTQIGGLPYSLIIDLNMPPDLDDTAAAFTSLRENGIHVEESGLEYSLYYRSPDGLFYTWMNEDKWLNESDPLNWFYKQNQTDALVNANMLYALSLAGKQAPEVSIYLNSYIKNKSFTEPTMYYYNPYTQLYMLTRAYADGYVEDLKPSMPIVRKYLLSTQKPDGSWGNEINTSLAAVSLLNTGYKGRALDKAITYLLRNQRNDGGWRIGSFHGMKWIFPEGYSVNFYWGSEEDTAAFSLEALGKYDELHDKKWHKKR